jgi:hypothetical protein
MSDKLLVSMWGMTINADGIVAIGATVIIVVVVVLAMRRRHEPRSCITFC